MFHMSGEALALGHHNHHLQQHGLCLEFRWSCFGITALAGSSKSLQESLTFTSMTQVQVLAMLTIYHLEMVEIEFIKLSAKINISPDSATCFVWLLVRLMWTHVKGKDKFRQNIWTRGSCLTCFSLFHKCDSIATRQLKLEIKSSVKRKEAKKSSSRT